MAHMLRRLTKVGGGVILLLILLTPSMTSRASSALTHSASTVTVFATGLDNPRGLRFGPDGNLYVADAGLGGTNSTIGQCQQVPGAPGPGPDTGGFTSRIVKIASNGTRTIVADNLPSSVTTPGSGSNVLGVEDVQFIDGSLYGMEAGAGCSHGLAGTDNTIFRVNADGTISNVADLSAFIKAHPVKNPNPDDFEPDGTWYSMVAVGNSLYAVEPNHGELDKITLKGDRDGFNDSSISRVADISASLGHIVPTAVTFHNGNFYVGNLDTFPITNDSVILKITRSGQISTLVTGLWTVLGVAFDRQGRLYVLESITVAGFPGPQAVGTGKVVRVNDDGTLSTIATGLTFPTGMTFDPDGDSLYVSNNGYLPVPGMGQIVRINIA